MRSVAMHDELADYVRRADILDSGEFPNHGAHKSYLLVLEGGLGVLAKPADEIADGELLVRREVAAWEIACLLGWADLVSVTILRSVPSEKNPGSMVDASLHVLWPYNQPAVTEGLPEDDCRRAGCFDAVIRNGDRHARNWLAVLANGQPPRLKLVDHGYAFAAGVEPPGSPFYANRTGLALPPELVSSLKRLLAGLASSPVPGLLPADELAGVSDRTNRLIQNRALQLP